VTVARSLEGARPGAFLRMASGQSRGFWSRGDRWVAHAGKVADIRVEREESPARRFTRVRDEAARLHAAGDGSHDPRLVGRHRWFGGFAFRDGHRAEGAWHAFPAALFVLPRLELEGDATGRGKLRARMPLPDGAEPGDVTQAVEATLEELTEELSGPVASSSPTPNPARGVATDRRAWEGAVAKAVTAIAAGRFSKVVLARTLDLTTTRAVDVVEVVRNLWIENRDSHVFLFEPEAGKALLGAAPETIATVRSGVFHATAVAGSARRGESEEDRARLAHALMESRKDREEQRIVVEDMVERLRPLAEQIQVQEEPHVLTLAGIQHLETEIRARPGRGSHVLDLVAALHPTPAVCGVDRDAALAFIRDEEPFERGWYAGPVGWFDPEGNGVFAPALRNAVNEGLTWRLFAGAGIVAGSVPAAEWEETAIKFEAVVAAVKASGAILE